MISLYMNENVQGAITRGLRRRGVDVLTAQEDGLEGADDPIVLDRALALGRLLFTRDNDLLREASARQQSGASFSGVVYARQRVVSLGRCIEDLELIAFAGEPEEFANRVRYLPLRAGG